MDNGLCGFTDSIAVNRYVEKVTMWIAWRLPRYLVMWAAVRLMAHATQGKWGKESPSDISIMDALKRWDE